jgi:bis(5'-nucleosyl)-tetraphosphatase (symmetrical)
MSIYAIGDLQGCFDELQRLLDRLNFDPTKDRIWFTGDLVERGPKSLETLRFVYRLGDSATTVLGNHDLHLIAIHAGVRKPRPRSSINDILKAVDCDELIHWLRHRQVLHHDAELGFTMVHAGLLPQWSLEKAQTLAGELESALRSDDYLQFMANMYGNHPDQWSDLLQGWERLKVITNAFTRLRYCYADGRMDMRCTSSPGSEPKHLIPWYQMQERKNRDLNLVCGHWATLGYRTVPGLIALDSGCVWGGSLTAVQLDSELRQPLSVQCTGYAKCS